jgi:hypothetical protein
MIVVMLILLWMTPDRPVGVEGTGVEGEHPAGDEEKSTPLDGKK